MDQKVVLCIDDDVRDLELEKEALEGAGYRVIAVDDARVGLQMFMTHDIDLVLLDFNFPKTDGGIIAQEMRRRKPAVPIAVLSGYMSEAITTEPFVDLLLEKPYKAEDLVRSVKRILEQNQSSGAQIA